MTSSRSRWAAIGAAIAVTLGAGGIGVSHATTDSGDSPVAAFFPIEPCRLAADASIGADTSITLEGWGTTGECELPNDISGLAANVTAVGATQQTNLRFYAQGDDVPETANLNPTPGAPPTPNAVNITLNTANGQFSVYNRFGTVGVFIDIMGYYDDHTHDDRYYTKAEVDAIAAPAPGIEPFSPVLTDLSYTGSNTESSPTQNWELIKTVGDFEKQGVGTTVRIDWTGHSQYSDAADTAFCHYQLRVDGETAAGNASLVGLASGADGGDAIAYSKNAQVSTFGLFGELGTGTHTVAIYVRGSATACTLNFENFLQQVLVTEFASPSD